MTATHATECANCPYLAGEHLPPNGQCPGTSGMLPTCFKARRSGKVIDLLDRLAPRVEPEPPTLTIVKAGGRTQEPEKVPADAPPVEPKPKRTRAQFCECGHARTLHPGDGMCTVSGGFACPCVKFEAKKRAKKNTEQPGNGSADSAASTVNDVGAAPPSLSPLSKTPAPDASSVERPESSPARGLPLTDEGVLTFYARKVGHFHGALDRLSDAWAPLNHILDVGHEDTGTRECLLRMNEAVRRLTEIAKARTVDELAEGDGCA